jgi:hypothetical protein
MAHIVEETKEFMAGVMETGKRFFAGVVDTGEDTVETSAVCQMQSEKKQGTSLLCGTRHF